MDLVLFIIILVFRGDSADHNYTALKVLSVIGWLIALVLTFVYSWLMILDCVWYIICLTLCHTAQNQE